LAIQNFAGLACPKPVLMIAMTARTGSTHLCAAIEAAGETGAIGEVFNPRGPIEAGKHRHGADLFTDYVRALYAAPGSIVAFKTAWVDFAPLAGGYSALFPDLQIIYLNRRDEIAQAVSLYRALISHHWHRKTGAPAPPANALPFDLDHICRILGNLQDEKRQWEAFFARNGLQPARLLYEHFSSDIQAALRFVADKTGLPLHTDRVAGTEFEKLADRLSEDWVNRVRRHLWRMT
jgi:LPS sulfotransferase NodH